VVNAIFVAREYCNDRSIAGQPLATVWTFGQHRLELAKLAVRRIDNQGEWVIASLFRRVCGRNIALKQFHARRARFCVVCQDEPLIFTEQRDRGGLGALRQLIGGEHLLIGDNHAFVGKQPSPQPKFERAGLLFLQRVEEYVPRN
jgi:hypothetical protein